MAPNTKYKIDISDAIVLDQTIEKVEVEKETELCIWYQGRKYLKAKGDIRFFETKKEANDFLYYKQREIRDYLARELKKVKTNLEQIRTRNYIY